MKYKSDLLHVNYWKSTDDGTELKEELACKYHERQELIDKLEKALIDEKITDFEVYGFANFANIKSGIAYGDKVYEREPARLQT